MAEPGTPQASQQPKPPEGQRSPPQREFGRWKKFFAGNELRLFMGLPMVVLVAAIALYGGFGNARRPFRSPPESCPALGVDISINTPTIRGSVLNSLPNLKEYLYCGSGNIPSKALTELKNAPRAVVPELLALLALEPSAEVRAKIVTALSYTGDQRAVHPISSQLYDSGEGINPELKSAVYNALFRLGDPPSTPR